MKVGDLVWIPHLKKYGHVHELTWRGDQVRKVRVQNDITGLDEIIDVWHHVVEAVNIIDRLIVIITSLIKKIYK